MRPGRQDLNVNFFTFRSCRQLDGPQAPCRPLGGDRHPFLKISHIFLKFCFFNIKMKKRNKIAIQLGAGPPNFFYQGPPKSWIARPDAWKFAINGFIHNSRKCKGSGGSRRIAQDPSTAHQSTTTVATRRAAKVGTGYEWKNLTENRNWRIRLFGFHF